MHGVMCAQACVDRVDLQMTLRLALDMLHDPTVVMTAGLQNLSSTDLEKYAYLAQSILN